MRIGDPAAAAGQPHAMRGSDGDMYYPDDYEDATEFAHWHGAEPVDAAAFESVFPGWAAPPS